MILTNFRTQEQLGITINEAAVFDEIANDANKYNITLVNCTDIGKRLNMTRQGVKLVVDRLIDKGVLSLVEVKNNKQYKVRVEI